MGFEQLPGTFWDRSLFVKPVDHDVDRVIIGVYALSGALAGLAGEIHVAGLSQ